MENRHAVIIGINDYQNELLDYCTKDALAIKNALISRCHFLEKNIYTIHSDKDSPVTEITGKYKKALREIQKVFTAEEDAILFYFAGHGISKLEESHLMFHDEGYPIQDIIKDIRELKPKNQFLIIDACESGSEVKFRGSPTKSSLEPFIEHSSGILCLFACQLHEKAREQVKLGHGLLTFHLLKTLENRDNYDEDGTLSPSIIQAKVSKAVMKASGFIQNPVSASSITGSYPFATWPVQAAKSSKQTLVPQPSGADFDASAFTQETRTKAQAELASIAQKFLSEQFNDFATDSSYILRKNIDFTNFGFNTEELVSNIVVSSRSKDFHSINGTLYTTKSGGGYEPSLFDNTAFGIASLFRQKTPVHLQHGIRFHDLQCASETYLWYTADALKAPIAFGYVIYHTKWGIVICAYSFLLDWDGTENSILNITGCDFLPCKLTEIKEAVVIGFLTGILNKGYEKHKQVTANRLSQIKAFYQKVDSKST